MIRRILTWGVVGLLSVASTTACGGDDATGGPAGPTGRSRTPDPDGSGVTSATRATTSATAASTTTTIPPYSFDGSVPPPELVNTGTDYVAIFESLDDYGGWLTAHNPEPGLADIAYVPGSQVYSGLTSDLTDLRDANMRLFDVDDQLRAEVVQAEPGFVTLQVTETVSSIRVVDSDGAIVDDRPVSGEFHFVAVLTAGGDGKWRIAEVTSQPDDVSVQL